MDNLYQINKKINYNGISFDYKLPMGCLETFKAQPPTNYYNHSNLASQHSYICSTKDWPAYYDTTDCIYYSISSDKMTREIHKKICNTLNVGDNIWHIELLKLSDSKLKDLAKILISFKGEIIHHVRCLYSFNTNTGYSNPIIEIIYEN